MKTLESLQSTAMPQLKAIARDLGLTFDKKISHEKLAHIVFQAQQPEPDRVKEDEKNVEQAKLDDVKRIENAPTGEDQANAILTKIGEFFGGGVEESENGDGETVFTVIDPAGEEIVSGTYAELSDKMDEIVKIRAAEAFQSAKNMKDAQAPIDPAELSVVEPERGIAPPPAPEGHLTKIEEELKPLTKLGLKVVVTNDSVELTFRSRMTTTTVHQPVHRIVRLAEQMLSR